MHYSRTARVAAALCLAVACSVETLAQQPAVAVTAPAQRRLVVVPSPATTVDGALAATQGFSIVLVLGDLQGGSTPDNLPAAAKRALGDMKDFLPYKSYRLLDAEWVLGSSNVTTRLRGVDDQEYALTMGASGRDGGKALFVSFQLRETEPARPAASAPEAYVLRKNRVSALAAERAKAEQRLETLRAKDSDDHPDVIKTRATLAETEKQIVEIEKQIVEAESQTRAASVQGARAGGGVGVGIGTGFGPGVTPRASAFIISTSFAMDVGETVVVGTSRLRGGDKALIALLTAVPRGKTAPKD